MKKRPKILDKIIKVKSLSEEDTQGLENCYVTAPGYTVPIYIPERNPDGTVIFPENFWKEDDWENYITDQHPGEINR